MGGRACRWDWRLLNPALMRDLPSSGRRILDAWPQLHQLQTDRLQNAVEIVKHLVVGEAENGEALRRERGSCARRRGQALRRSNGWRRPPTVRGSMTSLASNAAKSAMAPPSATCRRKRKPPTSLRRSPCQRRRSALVAFRLRLRASEANLVGMARPPILSFPHKGGRDANPSARCRARTRFLAEHDYRPQPRRGRQVLEPAH